MAKPGTFPKGVSGNPGGRPKNLVDVQALARAQTKANIETLIALRDKAKDDPTRLRAAIALHEIAWGKPTQAVTSTMEVGDTLTAFISDLRQQNASE